MEVFPCVFQNTLWIQRSKFHDFGITPTETCSKQFPEKLTVISKWFGSKRTADTLKRFLIVHWNQPLSIFFLRTTSLLFWFYYSVMYVYCQ